MFILLSIFIFSVRNGQEKKIVLKPHRKSFFLVLQSASLLYNTFVKRLKDFLHWLPVSLRIDYTILLITFKALHGLALHCIAE